MEYFIAKPVDTGILDSDYIRSDVCLRHIRNARFEVWMVMGGVLFVLTVLTLILTILSNASKLKELEEKVQHMEYGVAFEA